LKLEQSVKVKKLRSNKNYDYIDFLESYPELIDIFTWGNPIIDLNSNSITKKIPYKEESCSNHKTKEISLNIKYYFILLHSLITFRSFSTDFELYAVASFVLESHLSTFASFHLTIHSFHS